MNTCTLMSSNSKQVQMSNGAAERSTMTLKQAARAIMVVNRISSRPVSTKGVPLLSQQFTETFSSPIFEGEEATVTGLSVEAERRVMKSAAALVHSML